METDAVIDSDLALFLCAPITLDSSNFKEELFELKWTGEDIDTFKCLQDFNQSLKADGSAYWKKLSDSKTNVKANLALGPRNMMVKNYKQWKLGKEHNTF